MGAPNGLELSAPAKTRSDDRAELAGSALEDPAFCAGQRVVRRPPRGVEGWSHDGAYLTTPSRSPPISTASRVEPASTNKPRMTVKVVSTAWSESSQGQRPIRVNRLARRASAWSGG